MLLVSRAQGFQGGIGLGSKARSSQGRGLGSEESLQDVKQMNLRADLYVRSLTLVPVSLVSSSGKWG